MFLQEYRLNRDVIVFLSAAFNILKVCNNSYVSEATVIMSRLSGLHGGFILTLMIIFTSYYWSSTDNYPANMSLL